MAFPKPNTPYRFQNVDVNTSLELVAPGQDRISMSSSKEIDLQQWVFIQVGSAYKILAVATRSSSDQRYLTVTEPGEDFWPRPPAPPIALADGPATSIWRLDKQNDGSYVLNTKGRTANLEIFLRVSEAGLPDTVERELSRGRPTHPTFRWQILECKPLPSFQKPPFGLSSFSTQDVRVWNNPQAQTYKIVNFPETYTAPPRLCVGINSLDMNRGTNLRVRAYADNVDNQKYLAHIDTWGDTTLWSGAIDTLILKPNNPDIQAGQFSTEDDHPWHQPKVQTARRINFDRPFASSPKVVCFLKGFDTGSGSTTRIKIWSSDIDAKGFTIHIDTWGDTILYSAVAGWVAYPNDKLSIASGTANTMDDHDWTRPQAQTYRDINFQGGSFSKNPTVFVALNSMDISTSANLRVKAYVDNVTTRGLRWHIDSWADTKIWSAGISYIAFA